MATSAEVLASLNADLAMEHGAIMQYVIHAVALRDTALAEDVKRASREEMWHLEWLIEAIHARGGVPTLMRADVFVSPSLLESAHRDVATEQLALDHYAQTLDLVGESDPELAELIRRIMDDEEHHKEMFGTLAEKIERLGESALAAARLITPPDIGVAGATVGAEYLGVLQYLFNKYLCGDCETAKAYFDMAVEEMRHAGWAAGYLAGMGTAPAPPVPVDRVRFVSSPAEAREAATTLEGFAQPFYEAKIAEATSGDLRDDLERAARQHAYNRGRLSRMADA